MDRSRILPTFAIVAALAAAPAPAHAEYIVNAFAPSAVYDGNPSDLSAKAGVATGYTIDYFETTTLIPSLTYTVGGKTFTSLPQTFSSTTVVVLGKLKAQPWLNAAWDGTGILLSNQTNNDSLNLRSLPQALTFNIAGGTTSFGVGISGDLLGRTPILVNGVKLSKDLTFGGGIDRNVYVRIDAGPGDPLITSVGFGVGVGSFDHAAVAQLPDPSGAPEPSAMVLAGMGVLGLASYGWRRLRPRPTP
jgi:hypothetical protein